MRNRIVKLKQKKGKIDKDIKMCKNCGKEYLEKENFNWSCKTHKYDYSGEMWWCCGKRGKGQDGCQSSKHESKEDDEDEDEQKNRALDLQKGLRYTKCNCCKEIGHQTEDCTKDPNLKTKERIYEDFMRI